MPRFYNYLKTLDGTAKKTVFLLLWGLSLLLPNTVYGQSVTGSEYDVKIGFIYNFANYVSWPEGVFPDDSQEFILCIITENTASDVVYKLNGKILKGRKIKVISYKDGACVTRSHILYFATQDKNVIQKVLGLADGLGVLSIGEVDGFAEMGGVINFFKESNRLRFQINVDAAKREGLKMSSQLLRSAQIVGSVEE